MTTSKDRLSTIIFYIIVCCFIMPATAQLVPSDLMDNCNQWKITYPTGVEDKTLCNEPNNEFFFVNATDNGIVFKAPIRSDNGTTPNSSNIRSELRERVPDGSVDMYWTTEGTHMVYVKQAITHLPINKPHLVATQIHGNKADGIDDAMVLRLENNHLFLSFNGGKLRSDITITSNYNLGTIHEVIFLVEDSKHYCYYAEDGNLLSAYNNNNAAQYLVKDGANNFVLDLNYDASYFKIGNYTQSNANEEGNDTDDPSNYGEVVVYDFSVAHGNVNVTGIDLSPKTADLLEGNTLQLIASIIPLNASNLGLTYSSSNTNVATVNANGLVTAISKGSAVITATTVDGGFTNTSLITVVEAAVGPNLALNKPIVGTGIHDDVHEVSNLIDGLTNTRWSVSGFPQTAIIDLGGLYNVGRTELVCYNNRDYQFTVSISTTENGAYTPLVDRSANTTLGSATNPIVNTFAAAEGRYIKLTTTGAATYSGSWSSLMEFRVFESASLSTDNTTLSEDISFWPNPATDTVYLSSIKNIHTLTIYNQIGKVIMKQTIKNKTIDISNLNTGLYYFKLSGNNSTIHKRVIKN